MNGTDLFTAVPALGKNCLRQPDRMVAVMILSGIALELPNRPACHCPQLPVRLLGFLTVLGMIAETPVTVNAS